MGTLDCCNRGVKNELIIEMDQEQIKDKDGFPQDTDPAFRSKKIEVENPNENSNDIQVQETYKEEKNNNIEEIGESTMKEIEQNEQVETYDNIEPNVDMNVPNNDINAIQESNVAENNEYNLTNNENNIIETAQNIGNEIIDNNVVQGELNIDQILKNYNEEQGQNMANEEDYNKYFEQNQAQENNIDIDVNQYLNNNNQTTEGNNKDLTPIFTFGENQTDLNNLINSNNVQTQEYNIDYNYNI